jgi:hypothetical protein
MQIVVLLVPDGDLVAWVGTHWELMPEWYQCSSCAGLAFGYLTAASSETP